MANKTILIVSPEIGIEILFGTYLRRRKAIVHVVSDVIEGEAMLDETQYDIIFLDPILPDEATTLNFCTLCKNHENTADAPIYLIFRNLDRDAHARYMNAGATEQLYALYPHYFLDGLF